MKCRGCDRISHLWALNKCLSKREKLGAKLKILFAPMLSRTYRAISNGCWCYPALGTELGMVSCAFKAELAAADSYR